MDLTIQGIYILDNQYIEGISFSRRILESGVKKGFVDVSRNQIHLNLDYGLKDKDVKLQYFTHKYLFDFIPGSSDKYHDFRITTSLDSFIMERRLHFVVFDSMVTDGQHQQLVEVFKDVLAAQDTSRFEFREFGEIVFCCYHEIKLLQLLIMTLVYPSRIRIITELSFASIADLVDVTPDPMAVVTFVTGSG